MKDKLMILGILVLVLFLNACTEDPDPPIATATPAAQVINSGGTTSIALTSNVAGTTFAWTFEQNGVTGATAGTGASIAQTLSVAALVPGTVTYTVTPTANGLAGTALKVVVTVSPLKVTYVTDIKAILVASCTPCHLAGGANPNKWDDYTQTKNKVSVILDRVKREQGATGFMPRNGTKLAADKIALIEKWVADGLLENR